jgi:chromosome segregation protein
MQHVAADLAVVAERREDPAEPERLRRVEDRAAAALAAVRAHLEALRARQRELRAEAGSAGALLDESRLRRRDLERSIAALKERRGALDVETAELRVRAEAAAEAIRRDADATEEEALAAPRPEMGDDDPAGLLEAEAARLRRMGPINPLAAAEYAELAARAEFLEAQIADLQESRRELRKVITALDRQIGNQFHEAFAEIARLYEENFALLFPGGRGTLRLTEPDDPLETGVEIEAQPLGKKVKRLALLSGGERSLAALAFLFAVFRARPSPFYILDEVEAALDDANLRRFLRLTDTLRGTAQLAIVTHQQHTMEAADILYGVTMEPGESSQVVAKRLADVRR